MVLVTELSFPLLHPRMLDPIQQLQSCFRNGGARHGSGAVGDVAVTSAQFWKPSPSTAEQNSALLWGAGTVIALPIAERLVLREVRAALLKTAYLLHASAHCLQARDLVDCRCCPHDHARSPLAWRPLGCHARAEGCAAQQGGLHGCCLQVVATPSRLLLATALLPALTATSRMLWAGVADMVLSQRSDSVARNELEHTAAELARIG